MSGRYIPKEIHPDLDEFEKSLSGKQLGVDPVVEEFTRPEDVN